MRIFNKRNVFVMILLMLCIFTVTSVSASDLNATSISQIDDDLVSVEKINHAQDGLGSEDVEELSTSVYSEVLCSNFTPANFEELQTVVSSSKQGDTIVLSGTYVFNSTISVNKQLNFIGINDAIVDGNNSVRLFTVSAKSVTFKNITFKNGNATEYGGAIHGSCNAVNCSFVNNSASQGGAISMVSAVNCSFVNNSASQGGAIRAGSAVNCSFSGNSAGDGGAIYFSGDGSVVNCSFFNNLASGSGGAIFVKGIGSVVNCSFVNNLASGIGGAIYLNYPGTSVVNCSFVNNSAKAAGAFYIKGSGSIVNCSFFSNFATGGSSGAIYWDYYLSSRKDTGMIRNSVFERNNAGCN